MPGTPDPRVFRSLSLDSIKAGEIVESISAPNQNGRLLIRHDGHSYRAWKEELRNEQISERLTAREIFNGHAEQGQR